MGKSESASKKKGTFRHSNTKILRKFELGIDGKMEAVEESKEDDQ